ncbi:MAG: TetR family transcriptional regulator [Deltaproteobacteria bacterium]|nr:MAG: TetR family transcriptional regulator [Deltaproteobacteria bacterium]
MWLKYGVAKKKKLERAAGEYGSDFVRKLRFIRDPKERILFVAEHVFARQGFGGARMQEIADIAGVNKAMIHYYFESKATLYHAVLDKVLFDLIKLTQEALVPERPPAELLEHFVDGFFDYVASHANFSRLSAMQLGSGDDYLDRLTETFFKPLFEKAVRFLENGMAEGHFRKLSARHLLVTVYTMTIAYFSEAHFIEKLTGVKPFDRRQLKEQKRLVLDMLLSYVVDKGDE